MIFAAAEADGPQILDIAARAGVFNQEEVDCVADLWNDYLTTGPQVGGYNFIVDRDGDKVLGFACYGPRDLTSGVYDLYWIAVDPDTRRSGAGRRLLAASEKEVQRQAPVCLSLRHQEPLPMRAPESFTSIQVMSRKRPSRTFISMGMTWRSSSSAFHSLIKVNRSSPAVY